MRTHALRKGLGAIAVIAASVAASPARADSLASCMSYSSLVTCAAADVGELCQGGGSCFAIGCGAGSSTTSNIIYRCAYCPTIVEGATVNGGGPCVADSIGAACVGGGTCGEIPAFCSSPGSKFQCTTPYAGPAPTDAGADAGGAGSSSSSGCDIAPRPSPETFIGHGLVVVGVAFFVVDRKRTRRRNR